MDFRHVWGNSQEGDAASPLSSVAGLTAVWRAGIWGVRTRAITANSGGKVGWVERLILELKGPDRHSW
ncbi:hypothetical protein WJX82_011397 [Trebouxia sp. C0006]